jgi:hypothetical protein
MFYDGDGGVSSSACARVPWRMVLMFHRFAFVVLQTLISGYVYCHCFSI